MNLTFTDGILIASIFWFFITILAMIRCLLFSFTTDNDALCEYWDHAVKAGFTIAYYKAGKPNSLEGLAKEYIHSDFLEMLKENENAEYDKSNPCC